MQHNYRVNTFLIPYFKYEIQRVYMFQNESQNFIASPSGRHTSDMQWNGVVFLDLPGTLVPRATTEIAVTESLSPTVQPNSVAKSCINMVSTPIMMMLTEKQAQPPR